jgi:aryl-alcohol dehydrogenase-like predicted oxidoreductase
MMNNLPRNTLGRTGLHITQLGFGGAAIHGALTGSTRINDKQAEQLLNSVLDSGINFIDTAPDYGVSEDLIGNFISHRRDEFYLATKCGCHNTTEGTALEPGHCWSGEQFHHNINESLRRLKTDYVDLIQMHNPTVEEVEQNNLIEVLQEIKASGKTRFIGVSSTAPHLVPFIESGVFDTFQIPYTLLDRVHEKMISDAAKTGAGIIIRGGIPEAFAQRAKQWRAMWERAQLNELLGDMSSYQFVLRFTLTHPDCHTKVMGTTSIDHLQSNIAAALEGPLPKDVYDEVLKRLEGSSDQ